MSIRTVQTMKSNPMFLSHLKNNHVSLGNMTNKFQECYGHIRPLTNLGIGVSENCPLCVTLIFIAATRVYRTISNTSASESVHGRLYRLHCSCKFRRKQGKEQGHERGGLIQWKQDQEQPLSSKVQPLRGGDWFSASHIDPAKILLHVLKYIISISDIVFRVSH